MARIVSYTEEDIRRVLKNSNYRYITAEEVIRRLRQDGGEDAHMHDFADTDTITVKELRDAWKRQYGPDSADKMLMTVILDDISKRREPDYKPDTVWKDVNGTVFCRTSDKRWMQFGTVSVWADIVPKRPLYQMHEIPF